MSIRTFLASILTMMTALSPAFAAAKNPAALDRPVRAADISSFDAPCMQSAIGDRESAILDAMHKRSSTSLEARETYRDALIAAWNLDDSDARREAIEQAHEAFRDVLREIRERFRAAMKEAREHFHADMRECRKGDDEDADDDTDE